MHLLTGVEAVNGGDEMHGISELPFWNQGTESRAAG